MNKVVFLGPSLEIETARSLIDAEFRPPIKRGDIDDLLSENSELKAIGIIDGQFFQSLSISPKEVLRAIDSGVKLYGSSSMGVLRAVELTPHGMVGIGQIYSKFLSGQLDADDEVAMMYNPETLKPISEPLVNMRIAIDKAVESKMLPPEVGHRFIEIAKNLYYPDRIYKHVLHLISTEISTDNLQKLKELIENNLFNAKREDAIMMLQTMSKLDNAPE